MRPKTEHYHTKMTQIANRVVEFLDPNLHPSIDARSVVLNNFDQVQYGRLQIKVDLNDKEIYIQAKPNIAHFSVDECVLHAFNELEQEIRYAQRIFRY